MASEDRFDVLIAGGGPAGLLIGLGLERMGIHVCIIERLVKSEIPMYGRACTLYSRSLEYLDQFELLDDMTQEGFIGRGSVNFDKNGVRNVDRGWHKIFHHSKDSYFSWLLNLRLKYSEDIIRDHFIRQGGTYRDGLELTSFDHDGETTNEYRQAHIKDMRTNQSHIYESRFLVGADGARSTTRRLAKISTQSYGSPTPIKWVRMDGVVKTDMPDHSLGFASLESPTHGNVLWVALDHGRSRIGFALNPELQKKYGDSMTEEQVMAEARVAMKPFKVEFSRLDWHTVYGIRQELTDQYIKNRVVLAGDACHIHSSGLAQGMNTGIHDSLNLCWKLAGYLKGYLKAEVLQTYETERRAAANTLINIDRIVSELITGRVPPELVVNGGAADPNALLTRYFEESIQFNIGLGVDYAANILNMYPTAGTVQAGHRLPDVLLHQPGHSVPTRLYEMLRSRAEFSVLVFTGRPWVTKMKPTDNLDCVHHAFGDAGSKLVNSTLIPLKQITIVAGSGSSVFDLLGRPAYGQACYDQSEAAYSRYGISAEDGAIVVGRPDSLVGFACRFSEAEKVLQYFKALEPQTRIV
ncbi:uncharacterized protein PV06_05185 [Exophiala oligosperma]|uniref:Uncharacterized protein n=1 Tax=Exophiala oligosperma TaxID=215243 RepID=A0A0D2C300_9EURO|nr:uncharacterized protein PV06_05185 [Exophiala oligosperma]KIW44152.1 hypothetical protein PV06_05185 [Exophiala oligosperma]